VGTRLGASSPLAEAFAARTKIANASAARIRRRGESLAELPWLPAHKRTW
jgi:hypothetical protein